MNRLTHWVACVGCTISTIGHGVEMEGRPHGHVPPAPPARPMHEMSNGEMIELMGMDDSSRFAMLSFDELEWKHSNEGVALRLGLDFWYGDDYDKLWLKAAGEHGSGERSDAQMELLWDRVVHRWWSAQLGARADLASGPARQWLAAGMRGTAPYWLETEVTLYIGDSGRTAARVQVAYDLLLTQKLVLQPAFELDLYGRDDPMNGIGTGLAHAELGVRLRYEIRREFAPYFGASWTRRFGSSADLARAAGEEVEEASLLLGIRAWF